MEGAIRLRCEEARANIHFHLDGDDHPHAHRAREHASSCVYCERHLLELREVERRLMALPLQAAPAGLRDRVLAAVRDLPQKPPLRDGRLQ